MKKIGVLLCGSGFKDGSEIREAVGALWALSQHPVEVKCYAPDAPQRDVVNCLTLQNVPGETRNMLTESARIARGNVQDLKKCDPADLDALVIPGGFGAAKNLCDFALKGSAGSVRPDVLDLVEKIFLAQKPIGAICIAPAVLALALKGRGLQLTVGEPSEASLEIEKLGHRHIPCAANECVVDLVHHVVTTPAYMYDRAPLSQIFEGIQKMVNEVVKMSS